uniref:G_PROTEIN_RECEP_F1_2 domain-containing protein n=1 Tax=Rhabditophanes sp. KR3021 TaxID=114890 RepID=A0AC35TVJ7_9BILA
MVTTDSIINLCIFLTSILLNGVVLSLYPHFKINGRMNAGNLVIFLQSMIDIVLSTTSLIFYTEIIASDLHVSIHLVNFDQFELSLNAYIICVLIYSSTLSFNFFMIALTIWTRYVAISGIYLLKIKTLLSIFFINIVVAISLCVIIFYYGVDRDADPNIIYKFYQQNNYTDPYITPTTRSISFKTNDFKVIIISIPIILFINTNVFIIFKYLRKYRVYMKSKFSSMSAKTRTLGYNFLRILFLQICNPIVFLFVPTLVYIIAVFIKLDVRAFGIIIFQLSSIVSPLNALFILICLTKSRKIITNRFNKIMFQILSQKKKALANASTNITPQM